MSLLAQGSSNPGRLDRRVSLLYSVATRDDTGGPVLTWYESATVWAAKQPARAGALFTAEAKHNEDELIYRIRHRDDVSPFMRLVHGDDVYEIRGLAEAGRRHFLDLTVRGINQTAGDNRDFIDIGDAVTAIDVGDDLTPIDAGSRRAA